MIDLKGCHRGTIIAPRKQEIEYFEYKTNICPRGTECEAVFCWHYHEGEEMRDMDVSLTSAEKV